VKPSVAFFASLALLQGIGQASGQSSDSASVTAGKTLLSKHCSRCHQIEAKGLSPLPIAPPFRDLMQRYKPDDLEEALGEGLSSGHPTMPEFVFEPDEIAAIVAYFSTLRR
jgi:mono/diheme cytochrome c family protein